MSSRPGVKADWADRMCGWAARAEPGEKAAGARDELASGQPSKSWGRD